MYLSRITLSPQNRETQRAFASPSLFHGAIERSFASRARRLWRVDLMSSEEYHLLVLSEDKPVYAHIAVQFGSPGQPPAWETRDYQPFLDQIADGQIWRFRLCANPTLSAPQDGARGKVLAHVSHDQQKQWLLKRAQGNGFSLDQGQFDTAQSQWFQFGKVADNNRRVTVHAVTFEGLLTVTDADAFRLAMTTGIGRAKAYGCGLITVVRPRG